MVKKPDGGFIHLHRRRYKTKKEAEGDVFGQSQLFLLSVGEKEPSTDDFSSLIDGCLALDSTKVRVLTFENHRNAIRKYIEPGFSHLRICDAMDSGRLARWRSEIAGKGIGTDRKNLAVKKMRDLAEYGFNSSRISSAQYRKSLAILAPFRNDSFDNAHVKIALTMDEYRRFISTFPEDSKYRIFFEAFFYLGARCGEMLGLQWRDFDHGSREIFIHQKVQYYKSRKRSAISPTKTKNSVRHMRLSPFIADEIEKLREGYGQRDDYFIFFGRTPITKNPIVCQLARHCELAGVPVISPHEIRHTVASWLVGGCRDMSDLIVVQRWLGHSSLKETLDTYSHYLKGAGSEVTAVLDKANG